MTGDTSQDGVELLRRLADRRVTDADLAALSERARSYLTQAPAGCSLDDAFGLSVGRGGEPWYAREKRERRDAELRGLARRFCAPAMSVRERALWLQLLVNRYASNSWPRDRASGKMPEHYSGTEREYLFRAFMASAVPSSDRQLRTILRIEEGSSDLEVNTEI